MVLRVSRGDGSLLELFHQAIALEKRAALALLISNIALAFSTFVFVLKSGAMRLFPRMRAMP